MPPPAIACPPVCSPDRCARGGACRETERQNLLGAYYLRLCHENSEVANAAAKAFVRYELSISKTFPDETKLLHVLATPAILIPFALFEAHYMLNNGPAQRVKKISLDEGAGGCAVLSAALVALLFTVSLSFKQLIFCQS